MGNRYAVEDHDDVGLVPAGGAVGLEPWPAGEVIAQQLFQVSVVVGEYPYRPCGVMLARVLRVRQPFDPFPLLLAIGRGAHGDHEFARCVQGRGLSQHRPDHSPRGGDVTLDHYSGEGPQVHSHRQAVDSGMGTDEAPQRTGTQRFEVFDRFALRRTKAHRQPLLPGGQPDLGEVRVGEPAFPQPSTHRDRPQPGRIGVQPLGVAPLGVHHPSHLPADLGQVAKVVAAFAAQFALAVSTWHEQLGQQHADHRQRHRAGRQVHDDRGTRLYEDQNGRAGAERHRQVHQDGVHAARLRFGQRGRFLEG